MELDEKDVQKIKRLLGELENGVQPEPRVRLLSALAPFLTPEQEKRLPTAIALVKFLRAREENGDA